MSTGDQKMRDEISPAAAARERTRVPQDGAYGRPSFVEIGLAAVGLAAWLWCAFEVLSTVIQ